MDFNLTQEQKEALGIVDERKDFYFRVENAAIDNPKLFDTDREFILFIVLSRYCNGQVGYPSLETLAKKSRCSKKNMLIALKGLIEKGLVKKVQRYNPENNSYQSNLYSVQNIKEYISKDKDLAETKEGSVGSDTRGVVSVATPGGSVGSDTRVVSVATLNKEQVIKNNKKNHGIDDELDFFENLFREFEINFTKTNKNSVLKLRKHLSLKDTENYLRETYIAIKENKDVKNIAALFSTKIAKEERQINSKKNKENITENNNIEKSTKEKNDDIEKKDYMEIFEKLDTYDKLKIEEEAIELFIERTMKAQNYI